MRIVTRGILSWLLLVCCLRTWSATYVVAQREPGASDDAPGTAEHPWRTIARAARAVRAGDRVLIRDGIYREQVVVVASGTQDQPITFETAAGARVVMTGADQLKGWQRLAGDEPIFQVSWPHRFVTWSNHMTHPDDEYHRLIGRCEQVAIDNYLLRQVLETNQLAPGTFCVDLPGQRLLVWDYANRDLNKVLVEASTRQEILRLEGPHVKIRGFHFRFAANMAQHGAVVLAGAYDVIEDCILESMNSSGATFSAPNQIVRRCAFRDNGQIGFGANGAHDLLFSDCLVENNNTKGFDRGWEAGGDKLVLCRDAVLERSRFVCNRGNGIWFDIGNEHCTVRNCFIAANEDSGIFCEISFGLQAHDNVITGNGFASTAGAWGAQAGLVLSSSPDCLVERNLIVGNKEGFNFREQTRTTPRIGKPAEVPVWNHDELIRHNVIASNRDAQIWGWFDMKDGRQWPAIEAAASDVIARTNDTGQGSGEQLNLEKLKLKFEQNVYFAAPGQGWFEWGVTWGRHVSYPSLAQFVSGLHIDAGSSALDPGFSDVLANDYRLPANAAEPLRHCYPDGSVPEVTLGFER